MAVLRCRCDHEGSRIQLSSATLTDLRRKTIFGENMKLIMRSEFESLRLNDLNEYDADKKGDTQIVRIFRDGNLIAKKKTHKRVGT
jgi:hypothetical protein